MQFARVTTSNLLTRETFVYSYLLFLLVTLKCRETALIEVDIMVTLHLKNVGVILNYVINSRRNYIGVNS